MTQSQKFPPVPLNLLTELARRFPDVMPEATVDVDRIRWMQGQVSVVRFLRRQFDEQNDPSTGEVTMCLPGSSPKGATPPAVPPPPPPEPAILSQDQNKKSKTDAQASRGIKSLRIDRTTSNVGAGGGGSLNIPS